jgi:glucosyl-dolichyl phosphate glucuronosyltransferase
VKLDVVVPTYNRSHLLQRNLESLLQAKVPNGFDVTLVPVDNNSTDDTAEVVRKLQQQNPPIPIRYVKALRQGSSSARNSGIRSGNSDLIAFIDDDECVDKNYFEVTAREFTDPTTQFIGGPYLADWAAPKPAWLPPGFHAVIGVIEPKARGPMDESFPGMLMGGNAVIRRSVFDRVGTYLEQLGRTGNGLLTEEDTDLYHRLLANKIRGVYVPDLIIYHHVPAERLTRAYHRKWCYWRGVSQGMRDREHPESVTYAFGVPRYRVGRAVKGIVNTLRHRFSPRQQGQAFAEELHSWGLVGFIYGKHFARPEILYKLPTAQDGVTPHSRQTSNESAERSVLARNL